MDQKSPWLEKVKKRLSARDFPAEPWKHLPISDPIESTFATVRHRAVHSKGYLSDETAEVMVFEAVQAARRSGRRLDGQNQLSKAIERIKFRSHLRSRGCRIRAVTNISAKLGVMRRWVL